MIKLLLNGEIVKLGITISLFNYNVFVDWGQEILLEIAINYSSSSI